MHLAIVFWNEAREAGEIRPPDSLRMRVPAAYLMRTAKTKSELLNGMLTRQLGFCEADAKLYFKSETGAIYAAQLTEEK